MFILPLLLLLTSASMSVQCMEDDREPSEQELAAAIKVLQKLQLKKNSSSQSKPVATSPTQVIPIPPRPQKPYYSEFPGGHYQAPSPVTQSSSFDDCYFPSMHGTTYSYTSAHFVAARSFPQYPASSSRLPATPENQEPCSSVSSSSKSSSDDEMDDTNS